MAEAKLTHDWNQTASLMARLANIHRPRNVRAFKPDDFHPLKQQQPAQRIEGQSAHAFDLLKQTFVKEPPHARTQHQNHLVQD